MTFVFKTIPTKCQFLPTVIGAGDFIVASAPVGKTVPESMNVIDGKVYQYYAQSLDGLQWESGSGTYTILTHTLARTTLDANSDGTLVPVNFSTIPVVAVFSSSLGSLEDIVFAGSGLTKSANNVNINVSLLNGFLNGLALSTAGGSSSFSVAAGTTVDNATTDFMKIAASITKTTGAWAVGSGNGSLDTGSIAINTWYAIHQIKRPDTGIVDIATSLSATAPTLGVNIPAAYTISRRIGWLRTDASSHWLVFKQFGDEFYWITTIADPVGGTSLLTSRKLITLTVPPNTKAKIRIVYVNNVGTSGCVIQPTFETDAGPTTGVPGFTIIEEVATQGEAEELEIWTDGSSQIAARDQVNGTALFILTRGWIDRRGQDG